MISNIANNPNIPFTSVYKAINHNNSKDGFLKFENLCENLEEDGNGSVWVEEDISSKDLIWHKMYTLIADDSKDNEIETYCANHGIQFKKYTKEELLDINSIKSRIKPPPQNMKLAEVNGEKLLMLAYRQDSNLPDKIIEYKNSAKAETESMIQSGLEIPATYLAIANNDFSTTSQDTLDFIWSNGRRTSKEGKLVLILSV